MDKCKFCGEDYEEWFSHSPNCEPFLKKSFWSWIESEDLDILERELSNQGTEDEENTDLDFELKELNKMSDEDKIVIFLTERDKKTKKKFRVSALIYKIEEIFD